MLEVKGLQARYGEMTALWGVDLRIGQGELVAVVGPNGAGKSTLINAISGLVDTPAGSLHFDGRPMPPGAEARVRAGIVQSPEGRKLFPEMTVEENLLMGAYTRKDRAQVPASLDEVFELFPILRERRRQIAGTLSGGQQQMVAIGRALMARPRLLMLDEPSLGLAPIVVHEVFELLGRIHAQGMTILLVEQNVVQTLEIADRAYVLENGRIALEGPAAAVLRDPHMKSAYLGH
jgi:branched-chain amino acid transport system ATP-binding protein